jgi:hypothetical protein
MTRIIRASRLACEHQLIVAFLSMGGEVVDAEGNASASSCHVRDHPAAQAGEPRLCDGPFEGHAGLGKLIIFYPAWAAVGIIWVIVGPAMLFGLILALLGRKLRAAARPA